MGDGIPGREDDVSGKWSCAVICLLNLGENFGVVDIYGLMLVF
jgi:hypothetical protein